jgi:hypothetical protein
VQRVIGSGTTRRTIGRPIGAVSRPSVTVIAAHGEIAVGDISRQLVREWVTDLSVYLAPGSVHKTIGVLRQILAMAVAENRLSINPVDGSSCPR